MCGLIASIIVNMDIHLNRLINGEFLTGLTASRATGTVGRTQEGELLGLEMWLVALGICIILPSDEPSPSYNLFPKTTQTQQIII